MKNIPINYGHIPLLSVNENTKQIMKRLQELTKEINDLTLKIEQEYPELYQYLDENPATIPNYEHSKLDTDNFSEYLDSLKQLLEHHISSHSPKGNSQG